MTRRLRVLPGDANPGPAEDVDGRIDRMLERNRELSRSFEAEWRVAELRRDWRDAYGSRLDDSGWAMLLNGRVGKVNDALANLRVTGLSRHRAEAARVCQEVAAVALELRSELLAGDVDLEPGA